jgi:hypothetical protein
METRAWEGSFSGWFAGSRRSEALLRQAQGEAVLRRAEARRRRAQAAERERELAEYGVASRGNPFREEGFAVEEGVPGRELVLRGGR